MPLNDAYELVPTPPALSDYLRLRRETGLTPKAPEQALGALENSWAFCHVRARSSGRTVAMGRLLGDGGWYFHVADMATDPDQQGQGIGRAILEYLLERIRVSAPPGAYVSLIGDGPGQPLYRSLGFTDVGPRSSGMALILGDPAKGPAGSDSAPGAPAA